MSVTVKDVLDITPEGLLQRSQAYGHLLSKLIAESVIANAQKNTDQQPTESSGSQKRTVPSVPFGRPPRHARLSDYNPEEVEEERPKFRFPG